MKIVCAWCKKNMRSIPSSLENGQISHGLCENCKIDLEYNFISLENFIDGLNKPILIMDKQVVVQGANQNTLKMLNKSKLLIKNQNCGDVIQCVYADFPEGCGQTIHCSGCSIRNTVIKTYETSQSQKNIEAYQYFKTPNGHKHMRIQISTEKLGDHVLLQIDNISEDVEKNRVQNKKK